MSFKTTSLISMALDAWAVVFFWTQHFLNLWTQPYIEADLVLLGIIAVTAIIAIWNVGR